MTVRYFTFCTLFLLITSFGFTGLKAQVSGTYTINSAAATGSDNFKTFAEAVASLSAGVNGSVVFNVITGSGPYNEQVVVPAIAGTSAVNTITFNGNGATVAFTSAGTERAVIKLVGADFTRFNNLVIQSTGSGSEDFGAGVHILNGADDNIINNCTITITEASSPYDYQGVLIADGTDIYSPGENSSNRNQVLNNTITGGYFGVATSSSFTTPETGNVIKGNKISDFYNYGIYSGLTGGITIDSNYISRPTRVDVADFYGVYLSSDQMDNVTISRNRIFNPFGGDAANAGSFYGIYLDNAILNGTDNRVVNNLIYNLTGNGSVYGFYAAATNNFLLSHNTISIDGTSNGSGLASDGIYFDGRLTNVLVPDNIISLSRSGNSAKYCIYQTNASGGLFTDYNDYYIAKSASGGNMGWYAGSAKATLAEWVAANPDMDANSLSADPVFTNVAAGNYTPNSTVIDNKGLFLKETIDINGVLRNTTNPDMGAYEFIIVFCSGTPVGGDAVVYGAPACAGAELSFSVINASIGASQTYQWQSSTSAAGTYTNIGAPLTNTSEFSTVATGALYYRVAITCSGNTAYSNPVFADVSPALPADTYTIDQNAAPGTPKTFLSFNDAKSALTCGITGPVVFNVQPGSGPYEEQFVLGAIPGTSVINTITFNGNGNTIHFSSSSTDNRAVIKLAGADHIIFDSLTIDAEGSGTYGYGVQMLGGSDSNVIRRSTIISTTSRITIGRGGSNANNFVGIVLSNSPNGLAGSGTGTFANGNMFDKNTIIGGAYGVAILGDGTDYGNSNTVSNSKIEDFYYTGVYLQSTRGAVVSGNTITRPTSSVVDEFKGINSSDHDNITISNNIIRDPFLAHPDDYLPATGIELTASANNTSGLPSMVTNNIIHLTGALGDFNGIFTYSSNNTYYYHNTISIENNEADASGTITGMNFQDNSDASAFVNNIVNVISVSPNEKKAILWGGGNVNINNNDYFVSPGANSFLGSFQGNNAVTFANWKTLTGKDAASVNFNPNFTDPAAGDFTPKKGQVDNIGVPVGITTDIKGATRSTTTPDAGAVEFTVEACTGAPVAGTTVITPGGPVCLGLPVTLSLSGNGTGGFYLYQWQNAPTAAGPWTNVSELQSEPPFTYESNLNTWYRAKVVCSDTSYTDAVELPLNALMPKGTYTIDPALPSTYPAAGAGANFQTIAEAATALNCGIAGAITFDIAKATYTEQVVIGKIPGASDTSRVTFRGTPGTPADVLMQFEGTSSDNYVLKLDNASYLTFKDMSFGALSATDGRAVVLAGKVVTDSIVGNIITMEATTDADKNLVGVYADGIAGYHNVIKNNTITGGSYGIHLKGPDVGGASNGDVIDGNTISGFYSVGINTDVTAHLAVNNNKIHLKGDLASTAYGIYSQTLDSSSQTLGNTITIENTTTLIRGIGFQFCGIETPNKQLVANNTITTIGTNARVAGLHLYFCYSFRLVNNVVNVEATGNQSYGVYFQFGGDFDVYNNTIQVSSTTATNNYVMFASSGSEGHLRNNILVHNGGGVVLRILDASSFNTDYNTYYTTGPVLFNQGTTPYATLKEWQDLTTWDYNSIVYKPAFVSSTDLHPKLDAPEVWAIHGRGVQVEGNNTDIDGLPRPVTLEEGVPDMGAYEFTPTSVPVALTATPAAPTANSTQVFMLGTDTVTKVTWGATVPAAITARRYSGVVAPGLPADAKYMYFYTDIDAGTGSTPYSIQQYYVDSWRGFIPKEKYTRLAKTDAANAWTISGNGTVDEDSNILHDKDLTSLYKFTGLYDATVQQQEPPVVVVPADSTNGGTKFWTSYAINSFVLDIEHMQLYLGALSKDAKVTVRIHGTTWKREYNVPAGEVVTTELIPKSGYADARLQNPGISDRAISIESDEPITVNTYTFNSGSGAMLIPVGAYGHDYTAMVTRQNGQVPSFVNVISNYDNTLVEIVPSTSCVGHPANVPFTVVLNEGQVFQLLGSSNFDNDVSGTTIRSLKNSDGKCFPMAVFSGSGSTSVSCKDEAGQDPSFLYQQNLPSTSWGKEYMTVPTSRFEGAEQTIKNVYRIAVKNVNTTVQVNGVALPAASLINNSYYEIESTTADYIKADEPIMVAQYMPSAGNCNTTFFDDLDNDMVYLSAADQGLKTATFFRSSLGSIEANYLSLVVPNEGISSLLIDGRSSSTFDLIYPHTRPGYSVVVKRWDSQTILGTITCDTTFTGVNYGVGPNESYSYNLGIAKLRQLVTSTTITNTLGAADNAGTTTCVRTPFRLIVSTSVKPSSIFWQFSKVAALVPNADSLQTNPVVLDTKVVDGRTMYRYAVNIDAKFSEAGTYYVPVSLTGTDISGCDNTLETLVKVVVLGLQKATDFTVPAKVCAKDIATFTSSNVTNGDATGDQNVVKWNWTITNGSTSTTAATQNVTTAPLTVTGTYTVNLKMVTAMGCLADSTKEMVVNALPVVALVDTSETICPEVKTIQFAVKDPVTGTVYNWYTTEGGTTPAQTGATVTVNNVTGSFNYYVEGTANGCSTKPRLKAEALVAVTPGKPVVKVDAAELTSITFSWLPALNVIYYKVSINNGATWIDPSSGPLGLTHTVSGLAAGQKINLMVRAYNDAGCVFSEDAEEGMAKSGTLFIPNSFTPNGDGKNDVFIIQGAEAARDYRLMIFNQWGEKVFESADRNTGWDGKYKGNYQPMGVYIYVCTFTSAETGEKVQMKGSVNLLR